MSQYNDEANRSESANDAAVPPRRIAGRFSLPR